MKNQLKFPNIIKDKKAKKLIEQLLSHNPEMRHGGSPANLKSNPWFEGFEWDALMKQQPRIEPPFDPEPMLKSKSEIIDQLLNKSKTGVRIKLQEYRRSKNLRDANQPSEDLADFDS